MTCNSSRCTGFRGSSLHRLTRLWAEPPQTPSAVLQIRAKRELQGGSGSATPSISSHASEVQLGQAVPAQATFAHWQHQHHSQQGSAFGTAAGSPEQVHLQSTGPALLPSSACHCRLQMASYSGCTRSEGALLPFSALPVADQTSAVCTRGPCRGAEVSLRSGSSGVQQVMQHSSCAGPTGHAWAALSAHRAPGLQHDCKPSAALPCMHACKLTQNRINLLHSRPFA